MANAPRTWTDADQALLYTCHLAADLFAGRPMRPAPVAVTFPPRLSATERYLATSNFTLSTFDPAGDGSYTHNSSFFFATGKAGLAATAGFAAATAVGNSRRRKEAQRNLVPRWIPAYQGMLTVSDCGIYVSTPQDFFTWSWDSLESAEVAGFSNVILNAPTSDGRIRPWLLQSHYAELVFLLWAIHRYPQHPQLAHQGWLPPNWSRWASDQGRQPALES